MDKHKAVSENYFSPENLKLAYYRILCWPERLVKDRFGIHAFGANLEDNINYLSNNIIQGKYKPSRGFKFYEPKPSGTQRTKTLLMIEDALVYQAIANVISSRNYDTLEEHKDFVFGSVLMPETKLGIALLEKNNPNFFFFKFWKSLFERFRGSIIKAIEEDKATYKFETDITGFFDLIPHYNLCLTLSKYFNVEDEILDLLSVCLNAWSGTKENSTPGVGIPQGPQPSYLLANLLLHPLDKKLISDAFKYYRYMDDIHIYSYSEGELQNVLVLIDNYLKGNGLSINAKKTGISKIEKSNEDETVKELRRFQIIGEIYDDSEGAEIINEPSSNELKGIVFKNLLTLSDQSPEDEQIIEVDKKQNDLLKNPEELIEFWENELLYVENELPKLFKEGTTELLDPEKSDDIEFIKFSAKYGTALREIKEFKEREPDKNLLKFWLFALEKYFWRAKNYIITLQYYEDNLALKEVLINSSFALI